jgi:hypothetical protein
MAKKFEEVNEAVENQELTEEELQDFDDDDEDFEAEESGMKRFGKAVVKGACAFGRGVKKAVPAIGVGALILVGGAAIYAWNKAKESVGIEGSGESEGSDNAQSENESAE